MNVLTQPLTIVVLRGQKLQFLLLALIFVVRNSHHAEEAGRPHIPVDEGLMLRREQRHIFMTSLKRLEPPSTYMRFLGMHLGALPL